MMARTTRDQKATSRVRAVDRDPDLRYQSQQFHARSGHRLGSDVTYQNPQLAASPLMWSLSGEISVRNSSTGSTDVLIDVHGYIPVFPGDAVPYTDRITYREVPPTPVCSRGRADSWNVRSPADT
jgi:hypothetical protein